VSYESHFTNITSKSAVRVNTVRQRATESKRLSKNQYYKLIKMKLHSKIYKGMINKTKKYKSNDLKSIRRFIKNLKKLISKDTRGYSFCIFILLHCKQQHHKLVDFNIINKIGGKLSVNGLSFR